MNVFIGLEHNKDRDKHTLEKGNTAHASACAIALATLYSAGI